MATFASLQDAREFFIKDRFASENGMTLEALTEDGAVCAMALTGRHQNAEGGVMGGAILALADFTFAAASNNAHRPTVAQQVSVVFLNPPAGTRLIARAELKKSGRTSSVISVSVKDDTGRDVALYTGVGFKL